MPTQPDAIPTGEVTFLFTDIVGSTDMWERHGDAFLPVLQAHNAILSDAVTRYGGYVIKTEGDAYKVAFSDPVAAAHCAILAQAALQRYPWPDDVGQVRVRMAIHTGKPFAQSGDYFGPPVNRAARILSASHGGQILVSEESLARLEARMETGTRYIDQGYHQLKDLDAPVRLFTMTHPRLELASFPPPRSLNGLPHNLPTQRRSFVGREKEIERIAAELATGDTRFLTLTGPAGIGKTRLSHQAAAEHNHLFPDGIWNIRLTDATDLSGAAIEVADTLGIEIPAGSIPIEVVRKWLAGRACLLILDDVGHVPHADRLVRELLSGSPTLRCIATARQPLTSDVEAAIAVAELTMPAEDTTPADLIRSEGGRLFVERVHENVPEFDLTPPRAKSISRLLGRLQGGVPGNIEQAADTLKATTGAVGKALTSLTQRITKTADDVAHEGKEALNRFRETPELAALLQGIGLFAADKHKLEEAERLCRDSLAVAQNSGDQYGVAAALRQLGNIALAQKEYDKALTLLTASHQSYHDLKSPIALKVRIEIEAARRAHGNLAHSTAVSLDQAIHVAMTG
jgi:class 3 adenylate cyclase